MFNLVRRLVVIAAACQYIEISMLATWRTTQVLRALANPTQSFGVFTSSFIAQYLGDGHIRDSPLVQNILNGDTTPRNYSIFLESNTTTSTENCSAVPQFNSGIYNYRFLSHSYMEMVDDTSYNTSVLANLELVVVVVDCSFKALVSGDTSVVRIFNLVRSRDDSYDLYLVTISLSVQDYEIPDQHKNGPALLGMLTVINDMTEDSVEEFYIVALTYPYQRALEFQIYELMGISNGCYLELQSIPQDPSTQPVTRLTTSRNRGFYDGQDQSNIHAMYTLLDSEDTKAMVTQWPLLGQTIIGDSWAWVHGIHIIFGMQTIFSLIILVLVTYQNLRIGKIWIGDPFASTSTATVISRGILVMISWYLNSFWTLYEFALSNAAKLSGHEIIHVHKELVHADVLVVYLGIVAFLSRVIQERIDPSVAIFLFEIIHKHRLSFIQISPPVLNEIITYSDSIFRLEKETVTASVNAMSPMDYWSTFQIPSKSGLFLAASFFPKISLLGMIIAYALLRKLYRHFYPEPIHVRSSQSATQSATQSSVNEKSMVTKSNLTNFEISTGAELQARFGIISDYKNYIYFKGMKFASADGVYCSGYVIVNGKFLVEARSLLVILMIKLVRARFTNVYAYEVEGNTVKDTARLIYPTTFAWSDLLRLNVTVLL
ncbi:Transmembrane protein [Phytophthora megakarya]|uniref:Transmembrane protein n=1 Tax=Phytophthora megakarya TaxID=4795 RepID=A0A225V3G8_9STRA|nr:Transmembrane protein [Phytophthora megakarya]